MAGIRERFEAKSRAEAGSAGRHVEEMQRAGVVLMGRSLGPGVEISKLNRTS